MSRQVKSLSKTSLNKINTFLEKNIPSIYEFNAYSQCFIDTVNFDFHNIRDCSERSIVDFYISVAQSMIDSYPHDEYNKVHIDDAYWDKLKSNVRKKLVAKYIPKKTFDNNIDIYFNDVKREYILHPISESEEMDFCPENQEVFIKNNLKLVIDCAKRYQNLGLPFEDLIQIGNLGLMVAFEKFDSSRANLRVAIIEDINNFHSQSFTYNEACKIIEDNFSYSKLLSSTIKTIPDDGFRTKQEFIEWTNNNIKKASFSSIAFSWIRAEIILELNKHSNVIRIPKSAQNETQQRVNIVRLDSINPHTDDTYHDNQISDIALDEFMTEDETLERAERQEMFREIVDKLTTSLQGVDIRILKKRFGIDYPFTLSINEIAESEGLSPNKVKYSIQNSLKTISERLNDNQKKIIIDMLQ